MRRSRPRRQRKLKRKPSPTAWYNILKCYIIYIFLIFCVWNIQANLEKVLERRGGQFFAGNCLTWAELHFLQLTESLETMSPKVRACITCDGSKYNRNMFYFSALTPHPSWPIWLTEPGTFPTSRNGWQRDQSRRIRKCTTFVFTKQFSNSQIKLQI